MSSAVEYSQAFEHFEGLFADGYNGASLHSTRADALKVFQDKGFPARRKEDWKYSPIAKTNWEELNVFSKAPELDALPESIAAIDAYKQAPGALPLPAILRKRLSFLAHPSLLYVRL